MSVASELADRLVYLADPKVEWRPGVPYRTGQSCLILDGRTGRGADTVLATSSIIFLRDFLADYGYPPEVGAWWPLVPTGPGTWNDAQRNRRPVLLMLEEAVEQAKWEGV